MQLDEANRPQNYTSICSHLSNLHHAAKCFLIETSLGQYMYVEASQGKSYHVATLQSSVLQHASSTCVFNFFYHMSGRGIGELRVYMVIAQRYTLLWSLYGDQG